MTTLDSTPADEATRQSTAPAPLPPRPPRRTLLAPVRRTWRQLTSMRTALLLLFLPRWPASRARSCRSAA